MQKHRKSRTFWIGVWCCGLMLAVVGVSAAAIEGSPQAPWQVRVGDDPTWAVPPFTENGWRRVPLLAPWDDQGLAGVDGTVWFRRRVALSEGQQALARGGDLGLALGPCRFGSYELYAAGRSLASSPGEARTLPTPSAVVFAIPPDAVDAEGGLDLALRVRRVGWAADREATASAFGGIFALASRQNLQLQLALGRSRALLADVPLLILAVLFVVAALYHLFLFFSRRRETPYLWFALFSLCFAINTLSNSDWSRATLGRLDLILRLGEPAGHIAAVFAIQFLWVLFNRPIGRWLRAYQLSQLAWALVILLSPASLLYATNTVRWLWLLPLLVVSAVVLYREARGGSEDARLISLGGIVLIACELAEMAVELIPGAPLQEFPFAPLGFATVLASMGFALSARFRRVFDERENLRHRLEEKVQERTAALSRATEKALEASRLKSEFLANISHEIRTPLNGVIGMTGLLAATPLTDSQADYVETIRTSGESLMGLINDMLDFSKIESGKLVVEHAPFDLTTVVEECLDLVAPLAAKKGLELNYEVTPGTPTTLEGDAARTRQILVNLLGNAVKFTDRGEVLVEIDEPHPVSGEPPGDRLEIHLAVRDTGIGIATDKLDSLFIPFHQLDGSTTRKYGGSGLGLVISKRLVELMGGRIWVESRSHHGTNFHFTLVGKRVPALPEPVDPARVVAGKRLLLVAPHPTTRRLLSRWIGRWGLALEAVGNVEEAMACLDGESRPEAVLLDVSVAPKGPLELVRQVARRMAPEGSALLLLGSVLEVQDLASHLPPGTVVLAKPIKPSPLLEALVSVLAPEPLGAISEPGAPSFDTHFALRHPLRILLAEDHVVNQKVTSLMLGRLGYACDVSANGYEALEALTAQPYDVVLMDVQMPEMDGLEATRKLRRYPPRGYRPYIVALTAHAMQGDRERCLAAGMDDYLEKPLRMEALKKALRRANRVLRASGIVFGSFSVAPEAPPVVSPPEPATVESVSDGGETMEGLPAEVLDPERLEILRELEEASGEPLVEGLIRSYLDRTREDLKSVAELIARGDREALGHVAHRLKGASSNLGLPRLTALFKVLEGAAPDASEEALEAMCTPLPDELEKACSAFAGWLPSPAPEDPEGRADHSATG